MKQKIKTIITGGHITPALAIIDELQSRGIEVVCLGSKYSIRGEKTLSFEAQELAVRRIPHYHIHAGKLNRSLSLSTFSDLLRTPLGILESLILIIKIKPNIIISFGGYIALHVAIAGKLLSVPIYTHEQTIVPGLSNRLIAPLSRIFFTTFTQSQSYISHQRIIQVGNPIRKEIISPQGERVKFFSNSRPILLILGGSLGSHWINDRIEKILIKLTQTFNVFHQTGNIQQYGDFERLKKHENQNYKVVTHIPSNQIGWVYRDAELVVCRAGANTIVELLALKKLSVLIPLPKSGYGEQQEHALLLRSKGVSLVCTKESTENDLLQTILSVYKNRKEMLKNFSEQHKKSRSSAVALVEEVLLDYENKKNTY